MLKRKTIIIDRTLQLRYAGVVIAAMIFSIVLIFIGALQYKIWLAPPGSEKAIFGLAVFLAMIFIGFGLLVTVFAIFASHKFAGPMYRFKKVLESVKDGDLTVRASLREKDELKDFQEILNQAIGSIHKKIRADVDKMANSAHDIRTIRKALTHLPDANTSKDIDQKLGTMEKKLDEFGTQYKI